MYLKKYVKFEALGFQLETRSCLVGNQVRNEHNGNIRIHFTFILEYCNKG
jgi:hypothetical protein